MATRARGVNRYFNKPSLLKKMRDVRDLINKPNMFRDLDNEVDVYTFFMFPCILGYQNLFRLYLFRIVKRLVEGFIYSQMYLIC